MISKKQNKLIIVCGPTATGKTSLAIKLAKEFSAKRGPASGWNGEIISADSRQVYRGMDIGTGKDIENFKFHFSQENLLKASNSNFKSISNHKFQIGYYVIDGVKVWLYDVVEPDRLFSAADYCQLAWEVLKDVWQRGKLPIIVGGTGFYIQSLVDGIENLGTNPDKKLRAELEELTLSKLQNKLQKINPHRWANMNNSDQNNPRRLIRAIEIAVYSKQQTANSKKLHPVNRNLHPLFIGLTMPKEILYKKTDTRVEAMIQKGLEKEVKNLLEQGYDWNLPSMSGIGYSQWRPLFEQQSTLENVIQKIKSDTHAFVNRQLIWFKRDSRINWFDTTHPDCYNKINQIAYEYTKN